ncbi:MAG: hypothetical protein ACYC1E_03710 [Propionibacteriaceae bacterium]
MIEFSISRRGILLAAAGLAVSSGCASEADRINRLVFNAVRKDPLFLWHPAWAIGTSDREIRLGGIYPEAAPSLKHDLEGRPLPSTALNDAINVALSGGWQARDDGLGYAKPIAEGQSRLWLTLSDYRDLNVLSMNFVG